MKKFDWTKSQNVTREMADAYAQDGFLLIENFKSDAACDALRARCDQLVDQFDPSQVQSIFSTSGQDHARDHYFKQSGGNISYFFEEGAFDAGGELVVDKTVALNKLGHAMHDLDDEFHRFSHGPDLDNLAKGIGLRLPQIMQSMYIFKQPRIGGEVHPHQDATFLYTDPISVTGFWFALEDADASNGAMLAVPGGHKESLRQRFHYEDGDLRMETLDPAPLSTSGEICLEARKGSLIVLHGLLPHRSTPNTSPRSRHAYTLHVIDGETHWAEDNWLQRPAEMPAVGFV